MGWMPDPVAVDLTEDIRSYWLKRVRQHTGDSYAGITLAKFPEDLRVYEHLLWESRANVVIELGALSGASALWFRDRLTTIARYGRIDTPRVITVDIAIETAITNIAALDPRYEESITAIGADVCEPDLPSEVARHVPAGARCLVVEDSAHVYETTRAALDGFARFVPELGYFVVEDGCVDIDEMRLTADWPRGVLPAVDDWLASELGRTFTVRRDLELYGLSCHPRGFLQRRA